MKWWLSKNLPNILQQFRITLIRLFGENLAESPAHGTSSLALQIRACFGKGKLPLQMYLLPSHNLCSPKIGLRRLPTI